jgi:outer membrane murein-binding lipoprotein Lpp
MSDAIDMLTTGASVVAGGGVSALAVRVLFTSFKEQLDGMARTLKELVEKSDARHEKLIERITTAENEAKAAHRRLDEMQRKGRR